MVACTQPHCLVQTIPRSTRIRNRSSRVEPVSCKTVRSGRRRPVIRRTAALAILVMVGAVCAAQAAPPKPAMQHRHELSALFTLDRGWRPVSDYDLRQYNLHFHKILASCKISSEYLTNTVIALAYKAGDQGQR